MLSLRLKTIANMIEKGMVIADIGSDHAYLPSYLVINGIIDKAYACDIADGPLSYATKTIEKYQLANKIDVIKSNGLNNVKKEDITALVIAGMGGYLISEILSANNKSYLYRLNNLTDLYLQPNNAELLLRKWLMNNDWQIIEEKIIEEENRYYEIIHAKKGKAEYNEKELMFGPKLINEKNNAFNEKWNKQLNHYQNICPKVNDLQRLKELKNTIKLIQEVLNHET